MSSRKNRPKKYASKFETRKQKKSHTQFQFNITKLAWNYMVAKKAMMLLEQKGLGESATFFSGLLRGYDDWWDEAGIDQDKFNELQSKMDLKQNTLDARELVENVIKAKIPLVHMPGQTISGIEQKAAKEIFDKQLKRIEK